MSLRVHYHRTVRRGNGAVLPNSTVSLFQPGTTDPIAQPVYSAAAGTSELGATWVAVTGVVDFYLENPEVVDVRISPAGGEASILFANQWVGDAENMTKEGLSASGALPGQVPTADGNGQWDWSDPTFGVNSVNGLVGDVVLTATDVGAIPVSDSVSNIVVLTQFQYADLETKDPLTLYIVVPGPVESGGGEQ